MLKNEKPAVLWIAHLVKWKGRGEVVIEQMCLDPVDIKREMKEIIKQYSFNEDLTQLLYSFIDSKEIFSFAESAILHYVVFGGKNLEVATKLGAGIEILILSSDIMDDLEDEDNHQALWMKINRSESLNAALFLYTIGLTSIHSMDINPLIFKYVLKYVKEAMQGQHDDITNKSKTEDECLEVIRLKCGSLIALANVTGVILATDEYNEIVERYSYYKGIVAQISGDYHVLFSGNRSDIEKNKQTLIYLYLKRVFNEASKELLYLFSNKDLYHKALLNKDKFAEKLIKAGVTQYVSVLLQLYKQKCISAIEQLNLYKEKKDLIKKHLLNYKKGDENARPN
ncbi:Isoprenyl transferase (pre-ComX modification) [Bacillus mojavensis]|uniref:Isoprenyl transferase (Pre-ComX modification) n=2 Tax=Bacillaceae TaxID=186817 RepID=A0ABX6M041_BACMO|nr:Isoprenyl transferase (pre-ComX modification) [Bacillus mojavensis]